MSVFFFSDFDFYIVFVYLFICMEIVTLLLCSMFEMNQMVVYIGAKVKVIFLHSILNKIQIPL